MYRRRLEVLNGYVKRSGVVRRHLKGSVLAGFVALAVGAFGPAIASAETLADALVSAYKQSHLLDQNRAVLRAADEDAAQAVAALRPVFAWVLQPAYAKTRSSEGAATSLSLTADMTLYDFGRSGLAIDLARETVLATREALVNIEQSVLLSAISAYFGVKSASETVAINDNSVRVIGEALKAAQDRFDVGEVTRTDVSLAEASLAAARASLAAATGSLAASREAYKAATGHYPDRLSAAPKLPPLPKSLDEARSIAQRNHPAVREAQRQVTIAELRVAAAAAERNPSIGLSGAAGVYDDGANTASLGLSLSQPIYAGGKLSSLHRQAIASRDAARAALLQTGVTITQNVGNAWANIAVSRAQISATDQQIRAAQAAYNGVKEEATLGARTTLDVLNAEQDLLDAQNSRITADANLQIAVYSLLSSMGLLTAEHLNLGIPTYDPAAYYAAVKNAPSTSVQGKSLDRVLRAIGKN